MVAPRAPRNSPADSISLSPSSHFGDTQHGGQPLQVTQLCSPAAGLAARHHPKPPHLQGGAQQSGLGERGRQLPPQSFRLGRITPPPSPKSPFAFIHSISATAPGVPGPPQPSHKLLCAGPGSPGSRGSRGWFRRLLRSSIKRIAGPHLSHLLPRLVTLSLHPCPPRGGCYSAFSQQGSSSPQNTAEPQARGSLDTPGNREHRAAGTSPCKPGPATAHPVCPSLGCQAGEQG